MEQNMSDTAISGIVLFICILSDYMFRPLLIRTSSGRKFFVKETVQFI